MRLETLGATRSRLALFAWSVALRAAFCLALVMLTGLSARDLSLFFDGHIYQLIARTFPQPYVDIHAQFPQFPKSPTYLTAWFPVYPFLIWTADALLKDLRLAALAVSWTSAGLAVVAFYELARRVTNRPMTAALVFSFLPPTWLMCGSLAFLEPVFVGLFTAAMGFFIAGRRSAAIAAAGLAIVAQKTGVLILPVFFLSLWDGSPVRTLRRFAPYLAALLPAAALQLYLWLVFSSPFINIETHQRVYGGTYLALPFQALLTGLLDPDSALPGMFWTRKLMSLASLVFYAGTWAWCWRRREPAETPLLAWLGVVTAFCVTLAGSWGYYAFPRLCVVAAPPALLLLARRAGGPLSRYAGALLLLAPLAVLYGVHDAEGHMVLWTRIWPRDYFLALVAQLQAWR